MSSSYDDLDRYDLFDEHVYTREKKRIIVAVNGRIESQVPVRPDDIARELGAQGKYIRHILRKEYRHTKHKPWFLTHRESDDIADEIICRRK